MSTRSEAPSVLVLPPPRSKTGAVGWMRVNLFSTWYNGAITVLVGIALGLALWFGLGWILLEADWSEPQRLSRHEFDFLFDRQPVQPAHTFHRKLEYVYQIRSALRPGFAAASLQDGRGRLDARQPVQHLV